MNNSFQHFQNFFILRCIRKIKRNVKMGYLHHQRYHSTEAESWTLKRRYSGKEGEYEISSKIIRKPRGGESMWCVWQRAEEGKKHLLSAYFCLALHETVYIYYLESSSLNLKIEIIEEVEERQHKEAGELAYCKFSEILHEI